MNYQKHYNALILRAQHRSISGYLERHHITPRCLGGDDGTSNIVELTPEEHYVAHQLLVKIYPNNNGLVYAALRMTQSSQTNNRNNKWYGWLKRKYIFVCRQRTGHKNPSYGKPWYYNPLTFESKKFSLDSVPEGWFPGRYKKKTTNCILCFTDTGRYLAKWCNDCRVVARAAKRPSGAVRQVKVKTEFTNDEKISALIACHGHIRSALFSLGLNDSGSHYRKMKELKALVYPLATNQLKG